MFENISKKKKNILLFSLLAFLLFLIILFLFSMEKEKKNKVEKITDNKIEVAVCPTYSNLLLAKQNTWYNVVSTRSTAESLKLLDKDLVDYVVSGRPPKPLESEYKYFYINKSGYSFLGSESASFYINDLKDREIYTDLQEDDIEFLKNDLKLNNIIRVEDVYNRSEPSLAITTWENTDYSRDSIVHVYNNNNERYKYSRTLILYCKNCDKEIVSLFIKELNN